MKRAFLFGLVVCSLALSGLHAQTMSREEEIVRNAYAKLSLMCEVGVLTENIIFLEGGDRLSQQQIDRKMTEAIPTYDLSNFQVGDLTSLKDQPLGNFVSLPSEGQRVLRISGEAISYTDPPHRESDPVMHWGIVKVHWTNPNKHDFPDMRTPISQLLTWSLQEIKGPGSPPQPMQTLTYTRYAAFTVNATFRNESTGPYKALFLFGTYGKGKEQILAYDLMSGEHDNVGLGNILTEHGYPEAFLQSRLRENPVIASWIRANEMPASSCNAVKVDLCCSKGRCGISETDLNKDLSAPIPVAQK